MSYVKTNTTGTFYYKDPEKKILHRTDGPAIENTNGTKYWYVNGKLHRTDGPAIEFTSGFDAWYKRGKLHRTDGPAIKRSGGSHEWYINNKLHREDGPAVQWVSIERHRVDDTKRAAGNRYWLINGKRHRLDGPAVEWFDGSTVWYVNGVRYEEEAFPTAVAHWLSYKEITQQEIQDLIGNYRIVEWV